MDELNSAPTTPTVEIVTPAHNEADYLERCVRRLRELADSLPYETRITVVDSGSTDDTWLVARALADRYGINTLRVRRPGRGRAIRAAWRASDAAVLAYTDVDLSGDISSMPMMFDLVLSGRADLAIGSRLSEGTRVRRRWSRTLMSRVYAEIVQWMAAPPFLDLQCGLKVVSGPAVRALLDDVENDDWFFDTELLLAAWQSGHRVVEVPLEWHERVRTTVRYTSTIAEDLSGLARLGARRIRAAAAGSHPGPAPDHAVLRRVAAHELIQSSLVALIAGPGAGGAVNRALPRGLRRSVGVLALAAGVGALANPGRRAAVPISDIVFTGLALGATQLTGRARWLPVALRLGSGAARVVSVAVWVVDEPAGQSGAVGVTGESAR